MMEVIAVATITILAVVSPGADFAMVTRNSMMVSRRTGIFTAFGIALGVMVHVAYSMLGLGLLISQSIVVYNLIKYIGAAYLVYLGISMIMRKNQAQNTSKELPSSISAFNALKVGFFTNVLNPKTTLFIVALFTQVIDSNTSFFIQIGYGIFISVSHLIWFTLVALIFSSNTAQTFVNQSRHMIERTIGGVLVSLGVGLALSSIKRS